MQNSDKKTYIFIGRSGCGKGTQIELLSEKLKQENPEIGINYVSTGKDLREFWGGGHLYTQTLKRNCR